MWRLRSLAKPFFLSILFAHAGLMFQTVARGQSPDIATIPRENPLANVSVHFPPSSRIDVSKIKEDVGRVKAEVVTIREGNSVVGLLKKNGFRQDANALTLILDLNPAVADTREIQAGAKLVLPKMEGQSSLADAIDSGYRVSLIQDQAVIREQQLTVTKTKLRTLTSDLASEKAAPLFTSDKEKTDVLDLIKRVDQSLDALRNPQAVVSRKVFLQVQETTGAIHSELATALDSNSPLTRATIDEVQAFADDVIAVSNDIKDGGSGMVRTTIRTINAQTGENEGLLRVWYAPIANPNKKQECGKLSTPVIEAISRGRYVFWATRDDRIVSDKVERRIKHDTADDPIELRILP
jgi:hypothetical protein